MITPEVQKKIKHLEIFTRRLLNSSMAGDVRSAMKGSGFEFDQIREYQIGDDVRFIDRNSSARAGKFLVKQYREERNRTIILVIDCSASGNFSSSSELRSDIIAQIASVLTIVANSGNDSVGLLLFSDEVKQFIPPNKGSNHAHLIMEQVFNCKAYQGKTNINAALDVLARYKSRDALVIMISDFIDQGFEKKLRILAQRYDIIALRCIDRFENTLPALGFIPIEDSETGQIITIDARAHAADLMSNFLQERLRNQKKIFNQHHIDLLDIYLDRPFIVDLIRFFRRRMMY